MQGCCFTFTVINLIHILFCPSVQGASHSRGHGDSLLSLDQLRGSNKSISARQRQLAVVAWGPQRFGTQDRQQQLDRLYAKLLDETRYHKESRPLPACKEERCPQRTDIKLGVRFAEILGVDNTKMTLSLQVVLTMMWADPRLAFDSSDYFIRGSWDSGSDSVSVKSSDIWVPDIVLVNAVEPQRMLFADSYASVFDAAKLQRDGVNVKLRQPFIAQVKCPMILTDFPFDSQHCNVIFRSWANTNWLKLHLAGVQNEFEDVSCKSDEFKVLSIEANESVFMPMEFGDSANEKFPEIVYTLGLKRHYRHYALNVLMPLHLLMLLSAGALYLPLGSERIVYGVTLVLTVMSVTFFFAPLLPRVGDWTTFLEMVEIDTYMIVMTPIFFSLFSLLFLRLHARSEGFTKEKEEETSYFTELVDRIFRIMFTGLVALHILYVYAPKLWMMVVGDTDTGYMLLTVKAYYLIICVLMLIAMVFDMVALARLIGRGSISTELARP